VTSFVLKWRVVGVLTATGGRRYDEGSFDSQ